MPLSGLTCQDSMPLAFQGASRGGRALPGRDLPSGAVAFLSWQRMDAHLVAQLRMRYRVVC
jgi:hypothetical protein